MSIVRLIAIVVTLAGAQAQKNYFVNPGIDGDDGWTTFSVDREVEFRVDADVGSAKPGSLYIRGVAGGETPHQWRQTCRNLDEAEGDRWRLGARVRTKNMKPGARVILVAQQWDGKGTWLSGLGSTAITENTDWRDVDVVFAATEGLSSLFVMAYIIGDGEVWFDDFVLEETDRPVTFPPTGGARRADTRFVTLARGAAADLPWMFDGAEALERAGKEGKPLLVYVRCTDDKEGIVSALDDIAAERIAFGDDGYRKDVLFRAGPLTNPAVADLLRRRYVLLCSTYHLATQGRGQDFAFWYGPKGLRGVEARIDHEVGGDEAGSLYLKSELAPPRMAGWWQAVTGLRTGQRAKVRARVRVGALEDGGRITVALTAATSGGTKPIESVDAVARDGWQEVEFFATVPEGSNRLLINLEVRGRAEAWFDDIAMTVEDEDVVADGGIAVGRLDDPLALFGDSASEVVTPALLVVGKNGKVTRRLHRIGTLSSDLIDRWLRASLSDVGGRSSSETAADRLRDGDLAGALAAAASGRDEATRKVRAEVHLRRGDLKKARKELRGLKSPDARRLSGLAALRDGDWQEGAELFGALAKSKDDELAAEAGYWKGHCLHRLGRESEARDAWSAVVGETPYGRKAALAMVEAGPRPWVSESVRTWPESGQLPSQTETLRPGDFDGRRSLAALLELQRGDGSFTGNSSIWDAAITAVAVEAIDAWEKLLRGAGERDRARKARSSALAFLESWAAKPATFSDPFVAPYALQTLVAHRRLEAAQAVVAKIVKGQGEDGNWSIYGRHRPASFNTAQAVLALSAARKAGCDVPEEVVRRGLDALAAMRSPNDLFPYSTAPGHEWMTTANGSIGRDPLCELTLLDARRSKKATLVAALERFVAHHEELRAPTKKLYDYFNSRGHGGYFFFWSHRYAVDGARRVGGKLAKKVRREVRKAVLAAREGDGTFMDHFAIGRAYATAMALILLAETR